MDSGVFRQQSKASVLSSQAYLSCFHPACGICKKLLVALLVWGCSVINISPGRECCIKKNSQNIAVSPTVLRLYSVRIFTIHPIFCKVLCGRDPRSCSARCCVHSYTLSTRIPCLGRLDLGIFVMDFAYLEPLVPLHSFSQLGASPRTTCFKLQAVFIFEFS